MVEDHSVQRLLTLAIPLEAHVLGVVRIRARGCVRLSAGRSGGGALQRSEARLHASPQLGNISLDLRSWGRGPLYTVRASVLQRKR